MENSILESIMYGEYMVEDKIKPNKNYLKISDKCLKLYDEFKKELSEEQAKNFDNFINENSGLEYEAKIAFFKAGFKLALRIATECLCDEEN